jgi:hypothetical protein
MPAVTSAITQLDGPRNIPRRQQYLIPKSVKPRTRAAIENMVWKGMTRPEAAASIGMTNNGLYKSLKNPEALKYYQNECEMLRSGQRHRNLHEAIRLRETSTSDKARIEAMKFLENDYREDSQRTNVAVQVNVQPGYIVDVSSRAEQAKQIVHLGGGVIRDETNQ